MVTCFTGAILVFEHELQQAFNKERYHTEIGKSKLSNDSLINVVRSAKKDFNPVSIRIYSDASRTVEVALQKAEKKNPGKGTTSAGAGGARVVAFIDPYTGDIREFYNHRSSFFYKVMDLHRWMLGGDIGKLVVGISTIIFLFIIITGVILWWPRNRNILRQRLKLKTDAGFKRLNRDFHVVLGFYSAIFLFVFAFTGLAWSFEWFNKGIYTITGSSMERPKAPKSAKDGSMIAVDEVVRLINTREPSTEFINISLPKDSTESFSVTVLPLNAKHESASNSYYIDSKKGVITKEQLFKDRNLGQRVRSTFKPVHVGSIYGLTSKIIALVVCLLGTFFPLTGYIMWLNRIRKKNKRSSPVSKEGYRQIEGSE